MKTAILTGASGFIAANLAQYLSHKNIDVIALSRKPKKITSQDRIQSVYGSILEPQSLEEPFKKADTVFHCAAHITFKKGDFAEAYRVNVEGTNNVLEKARSCGVKKVVFLSACAVLGYSKQKENVLAENTKPILSKSNPYAYTKQIAEDKVSTFAAKGLNVSIANISTVYGSGDRALNSGCAIKNVFKNKSPKVPPGGTSYVTIDDLMAGLLLIAQKGRPGERYILSNENLTYKDLYSRIAHALGVERSVRVLPRICSLPVVTAAALYENICKIIGKNPGLLTAQIMREAFGYKFFDNTKARTELGWNPVQPLEEAVQKAVAFYKKEQLW